MGWVPNTDVFWQEERWGIMSPVKPRGINKFIYKVDISMDKISKFICDNLNNTFTSYPYVNE